MPEDNEESAPLVINLTNEFDGAWILREVRRLSKSNGKELVYCKPLLKEKPFTLGRAIGFGLEEEEKMLREKEFPPILLEHECRIELPRKRWWRDVVLYEAGDPDEFPSWAYTGNLGYLRKQGRMAKLRSLNIEEQVRLHRWWEREGMNFLASGGLGEPARKIMFGVFKEMMEMIVSGRGADVLEKKGGMVG